jgi:P4 family phage/plasmid primase-like protien
MGDYAGILPISLLTQKRSACGTASPELAITKGKRFISFSEAEQDDQIRVGLLKELTGGDRIIARPLFREPIEFKPQFKMLLTCNKLPYIPSSDGGTWRRLRVVPFNSRFCKNPDPKKKNEFKIDPNLNKHFEIWKESLMSLLIHKFSDYKRFGIKEPAEVLKYTMKYQEDTDINLQFLNDNIEKSNNKNDNINMNELFSVYKCWYKESGITSKMQPRKTFKEYFETNYKDNMKRNHLYGFKFTNDNNQLSNDLDA